MIYRQSHPTMSHRAAFASCTALAGSLLALTAPSSARAQSACDMQSPDYIVCNPRDDQYAQGVQYILDPAEKTLASVVFNPGADVLARTGNGIYIVNLNGGVAVLDRDAHVGTTGDNNAGVVIHTYGGGASAGMGSVSTTGNNASAIIVSTAGVPDPDSPFGEFNGSINVDADTVTTKGDNSSGIVTLAGIGSLSFTNVHANTISTSGAQSHGIDVTAEAGNIDILVGNGIDAGLISTTGEGSDGIRVYDDQLDSVTHIKAGDIRTGGDTSHGISLTTGGVSDIVVRNVSTQGRRSVGIDAAALFGKNSIQAANVSTHGDDAVAISTRTITGPTVVNVSTVETNGLASLGILSQSTRGDIEINAGTVRTHGAARIDPETGVGIGSEGIAAVSDFGTVKIAAGTIETGGFGGTGLRAGSGRGTTVAVGTIATKGDYATGAVITSGTDGAGDVLTVGPVVARIGSVKTSGAVSTGVFVNSVLDLDLEVGNVTTSGENAAGIVANTGVADGRIRVGTVTTTGEFSVGVSLGQIGSIGSTHLDTAVGTVSTSGDLSDGLNVYAGATHATILVENGITTLGDSSNGLAVKGNATVFDIVNAGTIRTTGNDSNGIVASIGNAETMVRSGTIVTAGDGAAGIRITARDNDNFDIHSAATVVSDRIVTTGAGAYGIDIETGRQEENGGIGVRSPAIAASNALVEHVSLTSGSVDVSGDGAMAIRVAAHGNATLDTGTTSSRMSTAIKAEALGTLDLTVRGATKAGGTEAVNLTGSTIRAIVLSSGSITGNGDALVLNAVGPYVPPIGEAPGGIGVGWREADYDAGAPVAHVENAGKIAGGNGFAIHVASGRAEVVNSGTIAGAVKFGAADDLLINTGTFLASANSDFGEGQDRFVNQDTFAIPSSSQSSPGAAPIRLDGLERFENAGGLIDLRNGHAGDVLALPGSYVASGNAALGLDVAAATGIADRLDVAGGATGNTRILLNVDARSASLLSRPVVLASVGQGSDATFTLGTNEAGFIGYRLSFDAGSRTYVLQTGAGSAVSRLAKTAETAQAIWNQSTEAWSSHMAEMRDGADWGSRLWGQFLGGVDTRRQVTGAAGNSTADVDVGYRQDYYGGELGYDVVNGDDVQLGLSGGYIASNVNLRGARQKLDYDTANAGAYAGVRTGPAFASLIGQYTHYWIDARDPGLGYVAKLGGDAYGARLEIGARGGSGRWFAEPLASIALHKVDIDALHALGNTLEDLGGTALTGRLGARAGGTFKLGAETTAVLYLRGNYVHEFRDGGTIDLLGNGVTQRVDGMARRDFGAATVGVTFVNLGGISGFAEGHTEFGRGVSGGGGRVGLRFKI